MLETIAFDFIGLSLLLLCIAVFVVPGPRVAGRRKFAADDFTANK